MNISHKILIDRSRIYSENFHQTSALQSLFSHCKKTENQNFSNVFRGIERDQWHEMGWVKILLLKKRGHYVTFAKKAKPPTESVL